jgi:hypothetical protein
MRRLLLVLIACNCSDPDPAMMTPADSATGSGSDSGNACSLIDNTVTTGREAPSGCAIIDRDTSACDAEREAAGITGFYRHFSCRVTLTKSGGSIIAASDGRPDFLSNYFAASDPCHEAYTDAIQNPNTITIQHYELSFPLTPNATSRPMMGAIVGLVLNGVPIFGNFAAPGDDIYQEAQTFDRCGGHPQMTGVYHDHAEPLSVSYDDDRFIGVMRDGYPIYGRKDSDGTYPTLDEYGGHSGTTPDSPSTAVYHYHVNEQTSTASTSAGEKQWFLTKGMYYGTPGTCTGC